MCLEGEVHDFLKINSHTSVMQIGKGCIFVI
jgi:hypothetical protein